MSRGRGLSVLAQAAERYLLKRRGSGHSRKTSDSLHISQSAFGPDTNLSDIAAGRTRAYKAQRLAPASVRRKDENGQPARLGTASINRPLALIFRLVGRTFHPDLLG
jgi:hypothetical protein